MAGQDKKDLIRNWSDVILNSDQYDLKEGFKEHLAGFFYTNIQRTKHLFVSNFTFKKNFNTLSDEEKSYWYGFVDEIPGKLISINLRIRQYNDFCRTCLIPYSDLENLARHDYDLFCRKQGSQKDVPFKNLPLKRKRFYIELNHLIPVGLRQTGYEIIRPEEIAEIDEKLISKLARAIHSRYLHQVRKQDPGPERNIYLSWIHKPGGAIYQLDDFEALPEEIRYSNLDNAFHIPTKLLSVGYKIRPVRKGFKPLTLHLNEQEIDTMARVEHLRWCWDKRMNGWAYGKARDDRKKIHPSIIPYEDLSESEKEKDRELVRLIPALLQDIKYEAFPVNPDRIRKLSYAIKPQSSIHRILEETRELNHQIRKMVTLTPEVEEMVGIGTGR